MKRLQEILGDDSTDMVSKPTPAVMPEDQFTDDVDIVYMDLPLFIRLLEYSREDAQEDADLHVIAQKVNELVKQRGVLRMRNYSAIINAVATELQR